MWLPSLALAVLGVSCLSQPTPHPETRSTWPEDFIPGEDCLPYDGSKVPDCRDFIGDTLIRRPYYHEHFSSKPTQFCHRSLAQTAVGSGSADQTTRPAYMSAPTAVPVPIT